MVRGGQKETERDRDRERHRETDTERDRERETERDRETERQRDRERGRDHCIHPSIPQTIPTQVVPELFEHVVFGVGTCKRKQVPLLLLWLP